MNKIQLAVVPLLLCCLLSTACESTPSTGGLQQAVSDYEAARYSLAHRRAMQEVRRSRGIERDRAAYLAGLSALQMGDTNEAELRLAMAARSPERDVAGRAKATLGLLHLEAGRNRDAGRLLREASDLLIGEESRQATRFAEMAAGDRPPGGWAMSSTSSRSAPPREGVIERGWFALQVGVFSQQQNATRAASDAERLADQYGFGPVRVIPQSTTRGEVRYLVQFGRFTSRSEAAAARSRIGRLELIVAPLATPTS